MIPIVREVENELLERYKSELGLNPEAIRERKERVREESSCYTEENGPNDLSHEREKE